MDAQAHLNNAAFLDYLQEARVALPAQRSARNGGPAGQRRAGGLAPGRVPATGRLPERFWTSTCGSRRWGPAGSRSATTCATQDRLAARARTGAVPFDLAARPPSPADRRGAHGADRGAAGRPSRCRPCRGAGGSDRLSHSAARCAGPTWTPTATSTTSSTSTTCRRRGSSCSPTRWAGPGRPAARSGSSSARIWTTAGRWTSGSRRTRCAR